MAKFPLFPPPSSSTVDIDQSLIDDFINQSIANHNHQVEEDNAHSNEDITDKILSVLTDGTADVRENQTNLIKWLMELNNRDYNESLRDEQRVYDSPSAVLQRLMATGMSRQAALRLLAQFESGQQLTSSGSPDISAAGLGAQQKVQQAQLGLSAAGTAISALASLFTMGISAPAAIASGALTAAQAKVMQDSHNAQQESATLQQHLYFAQNNGLISLKGKSFDEAVTALRGVTADQSPEIYEYMHNNNGFNALLGTAGGYKIASDNFNVRFGNISAREATNQALIATDFQRLNTSALQQSIYKTQAEIAQIWGQIDFTQTETDFNLSSFESRLSLINAQTENSTAQAEQSRATAKQVDVQRQMSAIALNRMQLTADDLDATALARAARELQIATTLGSEENMKVALENILLDEKQRNSIAVFNCLRYNKANELFQSTPELLELHTLFEEMNLGVLFEQFISKSSASVINRGKYGDFVRSFGNAFVQPGGKIPGINFTIH